MSRHQAVDNLLSSTRSGSTPPRLAPPQHHPVSPVPLALLPQGNPQEGVLNEKVPPIPQHLAAHAPHLPVARSLTNSDVYGLYHTLGTVGRSNYSTYVHIW